MYRSSDKMEEYCGVLGIYSKKTANLSDYLYDGLQSLQHRGQEGAGACWTDGSSFMSKHKLGLSTNLFSSDFKPYGNIAVGHLRYSTSNDLNATSLGPIVSTDCSFALAHNGHLKVAKSSDVDTLEAVKFLEKGQAEDMISIFESFRYKLEGSYAFVLMTNEKLIGMRDPKGIRPLLLGYIKNKYDEELWILSSESCAIKTMGGNVIRMVEPGEIIEIDSSGIHSYKQLNPQCNEELCAFEYIYFSRADSQIYDTCVHEFRYKSGILLSKKYNFSDADIVIGAPDSGIPAAMGYSKESNTQYVEGFVKNHYMGRSFIEPESNLRKKRVQLKLNVLEYNVSGKNVVLIDDSLVRGNTAKHMIESLKKCGAKKVYFLLASPPITSPCYLGIDTKSHEELIAHKKSIEEIKISLGVDAIGFIETDELDTIASSSKLCKKCFNLEYKRIL